MMLTLASLDTIVDTPGDDSASAPLIPQQGPNALEQFYVQIGRLQDQLSLSGMNWLRSWYSSYQRLPSGKTDEEYQDDGQRAVNKAFTTLLGSLPGGPAAVAADTEGQAILIWKAAQGTPDKKLKSVLESVALLKEGKAGGQAGSAVVSIVPVIGQLPFVAKLGKKIAKKAMKAATKKLSETIATSDRGQLATDLHAAAVEELAAQEWRALPDPQLTDYNDPRHALYALVVLRVGLATIKADAQSTPPGLDGRLQILAAIN
jgi:hypothetical protein